MPVQITFVKTSKGKGTRMLGKLKWLADECLVVSGGYGRGAIPDGIYGIDIYRAVEGDRSSMKSGFVDPSNGRGWYLPLVPKFSTSRHGFGIHPDGNLPGTKGCLGLQGKDIWRFWDKWNRTPMNMRPTLLLVTTNLITG